MAKKSKAGRDIEQLQQNFSMLTNFLNARFSNIDAAISGLAELTGGADKLKQTVRNQQTTRARENIAKQVADGKLTESLTVETGPGALIEFETPEGPEFTNFEQCSDDIKAGKMPEGVRIVKVWRRVGP